MQPRTLHSLNAQVVTRQSLARRFAGMHTGALERWAQCCSIALVAQLHPGRGAVQGCVTSLIRTPKWRFTPSSDADTLCHSDL